jgi:hypothetical protein
MTQWMVVLAVRSSTGGVRTNVSHSATINADSRGNAYLEAQRAVLDLLPPGNTRHTISVTFWYCEPNNPG